MLASTSLDRLLQRSRRLPTLVRYGLTVAMVLVAFAIRWGTDGGAPPAYPLVHFLVAILLAAAMFDHGAGLLATGLSVLIGWLALPGPPGAPAAILLVFAGVGAAVTMAVESLHRALDRLQRTHDELRRAERARDLLLREFRHRTRNDLGSLVGLLMLRARTAPSATAREALREAADHALALSRVHARLALDEGLDQGMERPVVDTRDFVAGLCEDIAAALFGEGLRTVRLETEAEAHALSGERAVPLGLVLNETVTNALKYAFPEDRSGTVRIRFRREAGEFVLTVADDGIGLPPEGELEEAPPAVPAQGAGLGTRLLRALAAQLRGRFERRPGPDGQGTVAELRFAVAEPGS